MSQDIESRLLVESLAAASGHNWFTLVVDSDSHRTSTPHKSDFVELHPSSGSVVDGITEGCSIGGKEVCEGIFGCDEVFVCLLCSLLEVCFVLLHFVFALGCFLH